MLRDESDGDGGGDDACVLLFCWFNFTQTFDKRTIYCKTFPIKFSHFHLLSLHFQLHFLFLFFSFLLFWPRPISFFFSFTVISIYMSVYLPFFPLQLQFEFLSLFTSLLFDFVSIISLLATFFLFRLFLSCFSFKEEGEDMLLFSNLLFQFVHSFWQKRKIWY